MIDEKILYLYVKCIETLVYSEDIGKIIENLERDFKVDPRIILNVLEIFIRSNMNNIDKHSKASALEIIDHFKEKIKDKEKIQEKINTIVRLINCTNDKKIKSFIKAEYQTRFLDNKKAIDAAKDTEKSLNNLRNMMLFDFNILIDHSSFYDEEMFEAISEYYIKNEINYIGSINAILKENPYLLKEKTFVDRVKYIIKQMNIKNKKTKKLYNQSIKKLGI